VTTPKRRRTDDPPAEPAKPATHEPVQAALDGSKYRAVHRLSNAADETLADVGDTCEKVPPQSLRPLVEAGHIEPVPEKGRD